MFKVAVSSLIKNCSVFGLLSSSLVKLCITSVCGHGQTFDSNAASTANFRVTCSGNGTFTLTRLMSASCLFSVSVVPNALSLRFNWEMTSRIQRKWREVIAVGHWKPVFAENRRLSRVLWWTTKSCSSSDCCVRVSYWPFDHRSCFNNTTFRKRLHGQWYLCIHFLWPTGSTWSLSMRTLGTDSACYCWCQTLLSRRSTVLAFNLWTPRQNYLHWWCHTFPLRCTCLIFPGSQELEGMKIGDHNLRKAFRLPRWARCDRVNPYLFDVVFFHEPCAGPA